MRIVMRLIQLIALLAVTEISAQSPGLQSRQFTTELPSYMCVMPDCPDAGESALTDSAFNAIAGQTIFRVNRTELNLKDPFLTELAEYALPLANANRLVLCGFEIRGAASPEGPYLNNVRLSKGRAQALRDFLAQRLDTIADFELSSTTVAEDYGHLLWLMERDGDEAAYAVRRIIESCGLDRPDKIKDRMQNYDSGELWRRLLRQYYPELRSARIVLYFRRTMMRPDSLPGLDVAAQMPPVGEYSDPAREPVPLIYERRHVLSLSSNLLYDAFWMPNYGWAPMVNVGAEYYPSHGNFTYRAAFTFPYYHRWSRHKFFQIRDYHLEVRRYFEPGMLHTGWYLGAYANATKYGIGLNARKGWQGEGIGGALKVGYVLPLGSGRWRLDMHLGVGAWMTRYDPYIYGNPITGDYDGSYYYDWTEGASTFSKRNHRMWWIGSTELGVTLTYDLLYKRIFRSGVSLRRKEVVWR